MVLKQSEPHRVPKSIVANNSYRKWSKLPAPERRLLLLLTILQPLASLSLRLFGFNATRSRVERWTDHRDRRVATPEEMAAANRMAELAAIAGLRGPIMTTCLRQALVVHGLLRRRGLDSRLRLGVAREHAAPDMHAWVELEGTPLAQPSLRHRAFEQASRTGPR